MPRYVIKTKTTVTQSYELEAPSAEEALATWGTGKDSFENVEMEWGEEEVSSVEEQQ